MRIQQLTVLACLFIFASSVQAGDSDPLPPVFVSITPDHGPTAGNIPIEILGTNFGNSGLLTLDGIQVPVTNWTSGLLQGTLPAGQGTNLTLQIAPISGSTLSTNGVFSYNCPYITSVLPGGSMQTSGGVPLLIRGQDFGSIKGTVQMNGQFVPQGNILAWQDDQITCLALPGQGAGVDFTVTQQTGCSTTLVDAIDYALPVISSISTNLGSTAGTESITLSGNNFGTNGTLSIGGQPSISSSVWNHTTLTCTIPEGQGANLDLSLDISGQTTNRLAFFSYYAPYIASLSPFSGSNLGGTELTLDGSDFGLNGDVFLNGQPCVQISWDHGQIVCTSPASITPNGSLQVTVAGQLSNVIPYRYLPEIQISVTNNQPRLVWPGFATNFVVESVPLSDIATTNWPERAVSVTTNGNFIIGLLPGETNQVFRLREKEE